MTTSCQAKADFTAVDSQVLLHQLAALPITSWRYKVEATGARHMGPIAQDFQAAFGLGSDATY